MNGINENTKRKILIDTDAGIDDAQAILLALACEDVEIVAITTAHGNVGVDQVSRNVLRLLKVADRLDIPVYKGSSGSLLGHHIQATHYHGLDGFGDVPDPEAPGDELLQRDFAVNAICSLARKYKGELDLICLAPLTNIALALRMDSELGQNIKHCYIMGGNYEGKGNITPCAEFNFYSDPEAAHIVLNDLGCPITMACWELCLKYAFTWAWYEQYININSTKAAFLKKIEAKTIAKYYANKETPDYQTADQIIMCAVLYPCSILKAPSVKASVELAGTCRGQMIVDWANRSNMDSNVSVITEFDIEHYGDVLLKSVA